MSGSVEATLVGYGLFISVGSYCLLASNVRELPWIFPRLERMAALRSHGRYCRAVARQCGGLSRSAHDVLRPSPAYFSA